MLNNLNKRITEARVGLGLSKSELARKLDVTPQSVYDWERGNTQPKSEKINALAEALSVSVQWLAFGEEGAHSYSAKDSDVVSVPMLDRPASAGGGTCGGAVAIKLIELFKDWVNRNLVITSFNNLAIFPIKGDSMTPTFNNGDVGLIDRGFSEVDDDAIYVVSLDNHIFIKRFQRLPGNKLKMISDNRAYDPVELSDQDNFKVIGKVIFSWKGEKH